VGRALKTKSTDKYINNYGLTVAQAGGNEIDYKRIYNTDSDANAAIASLSLTDVKVVELEE